MADPRTLTYEDTATLAHADMTANVDPMARLDALRRCGSFFSCLPLCQLFQGLV